MLTGPTQTQHNACCCLHKLRDQRQPRAVSADWKQPSRVCAGRDVRTAAGQKQPEMVLHTHTVVCCAAARNPARHLFAHQGVHLLHRHQLPTRGPPEKQQGMNQAVQPTTKSTQLVIQRCHNDTPHQPAGLGRPWQQQRHDTLGLMFRMMSETSQHSTAQHGSQTLCDTLRGAWEVTRQVLMPALQGEGVAAANSQLPQPPHSHRAPHPQTTTHRSGAQPWCCSQDAP